MNLDNDTGHFHPSPPRKSYNPFDSDDDTFDSPPVLMPENVYTKDNHIGFDLKGLDESADALNFSMDNGDLSWEEAVFGQPAVNAGANGHTSLFQRDGQVYTDKNVTDCELPEIVVCYKENSCQSIKDIGIDEGMPIHDKIWVQSSEDEIKGSSSLLALNKKCEVAMNTERDCQEVETNETPKSKLGSEWQKDDALHPSVGGLDEEVVQEDCVKITELKRDLEGITSYPAEWATTSVETAPGDLVYDVADRHPAAETHPIKNDSKQGEPDLIGNDGLDHDDSVEKRRDDAFPDKVDTVVVQQSSTGEPPSQLLTECREATVKPDKTPNEEKTLPNSSKDEAVQESANSIRSNKIGYDSKLEAGKQEDKSENVELAKPPTTQSMTRQEEGTTANSMVASLEPRVHGETSFASITFTGPVSYSGNISLRSESSAGSTRSFAFPILQTEWNSSPERMVKADQRHLRREKRWVQALICCRF